MSVNPVFQGINTPQPRQGDNADKPEEGNRKGNGRQNLQKALFDGQKQPNLNVGNESKSAGSAVQLDISQNVSMGVNKKTAQLLVETKVRTSISAEIDGGKAAQEMPTGRPGNPQSSPEKTAERLMEFARNILNSSETNNESGGLKKLREGAEQGFKEAKEILQESETQGLGEMVNDVQSLFMDMLDRLEEPAGEAAVEVTESNSVSAQVREEIAVQNRQAAASTNLSSVLAGNQNPQG